MNGGAQFSDDMNMGGGGSSSSSSEGASSGPSHNNEGNYNFMANFDTTMSPTAMDMDGMASNMQPSSEQDVYAAPPGVSNLIARFENTNTSTNFSMPRKRKPTSPRESQQPPPHPPQPGSQFMMQFQQSLESRNRQMSQASSGPSASPEPAAPEFGVMNMMKQQQQQQQQQKQQQQQQQQHHQQQQEHSMAHKPSFSMSPANNVMVSSPVDTVNTPGDYSSILGSTTSPFSPIISSPQMNLQSPNDPFAALNPLRINNFSSDQMTAFSMNFGSPTSVMSPNSPFSPMDVSRNQASLDMIASPTFNPIANNSSMYNPFGQDLISFETMETLDMPGLVNDYVDTNGFINNNNSNNNNSSNSMRNDSLSFQMGAMGMNNDGFFMAQPPTREQVPAETWENLKGVIRQLYLDERRPLKEVMLLMEERHNFRATPKMYKTRFSQWGFAKNNTEEEVKRLLSIKFQRDAEGKTSEFVRNGRVVNLRTYLKRKGKTEYDLLDHEANADLPGHTRCRTPPPLPNLPGHMAADVKRVQELITGNMHKALLMCKEAQIDAECSWTSTMVWGARSSDIMWEANDYIKRGSTERGVDMLSDAFRYLEEELKCMTPQVIKELLLGMINRDHAVVAPLCKFFSTWTAKHLERSHPLRPIFTALYSTQQEHGSQTLSDLIWTTMPSFVDDLEAIYGRTHPFVASALLDLLEIAEQQSPNPAEPDQTLAEYRSRVGQLIQELRPHLVELESNEGVHSPNVVALRYTLVQMMHVKDPHTAETDAAVQDLHREMEAAGRLFQIQYTPGGPCCYHEPIKVQPTMRRCRPRYDRVAHILEVYACLTVLIYYEEDMHTVDHVSPNHDHGYDGHMHGDFAGGDGGYHDSQAAFQAALAMQNGFGGSYGWA
ncbi:hypothetical protein TD95_003309 [Thielaviopsis punctulata]|uniref:Clr5 domain-containing protein n=1 Tax=Thielaviopsis punctulata TaxID=72032 RepID=A0A0F4ZDK2_9PEZI|nr:hypothetical protein TD95_003309 [Thielaviopsis punctulata]